MRKKGQIQQIFGWLFILVVAVSILFFGFKLIKKGEKLKDDVLIVKFFNDLDKKLSQYYYLDKGSKGEEKFNLPMDAKEVCFVNETGDFKGDGLMEQLKDYSDVFVLPFGLYEENRFNLTTKFNTGNVNPVCLNVINGVLKINLKNEGVKKGVYVSG